jgi:hypothetical protein
MLGLRTADKALPKKIFALASAGWSFLQRRVLSAQEATSAARPQIIIAFYALGGVVFAIAITRPRPKKKPPPRRAGARRVHERAWLDPSCRRMRQRWHLPGSEKSG